MRDIAVLVLIILLAAATPSAAKDAMAEMPPLSAGVLRFGLAAALLALTDRLTRRTPATPLLVSDYPRLLLAAVLCVPINQASFLLGVKLANASHAGLLYALNPVLTYIITLLLGSAQLTGRMMAASVLAFLGAGVLALDGLRSHAGASFVKGDLLLLLAVLSWSLYSVIVLPLGRRYGALRTLTVVMSTGVLLYSPALLIDGGQLRPLEMSARAIASFAFIAVGTSYLNYLLWFYASMRVDINRLSVTAAAAPVVAVLIAHFYRGEPVTRWLTVGAGMIVIAICLANWPRLRQILRLRS